MKYDITISNALISGKAERSESGDVAQNLVKSEKIASAAQKVKHNICVQELSHYYDVDLP